MKKEKLSVNSKLMMLNVLCIFVGVLILAAPLTSTAAGDEPKINVMTQNLYLGADIFKVVVAAQTNPATIPFVVADVYETMLSTNFWARAEAIADEIAANKPQVVGLQEVSSYFMQTPSDFGQPDQVKASTPVIDFYMVLDAALKARGMYYTAFTTTNADVELPMVDPDSPTYLSDVRLVDHDVILVRKGHNATEVLNGNYLLNVGLDAGGFYLEFTRGYIAVDVCIKGQNFRFVNTHLEIHDGDGSDFAAFQAFQMQELIGTLAFMSIIDPKPVILVGDLNSSPLDTGFIYELPWAPGVFVNIVPPYQQLVGSGYLDSWLLQSKYDEGYTSGFDEYVSDPEAQLTERIDHIFLDPDYLVVNKVSSDVVGDEVTDMVPNPNYPGESLWPSDHAGVVAKIKFLP